MYKIIFLVVTVSFSLNVFGQLDKVSGNLSTSDKAELTILNIYPDSFPNISVVFRAETKEGEPVWNLSKEKMIVSENLVKCKVVSLEHITKDNPINLGIVIDHSGSMQQEYLIGFDNYGKAIYQLDDNYNLIYPKGYKAPIENAKNAVKKFAGSFNSKKDFISIIGFSSIVDKKLSLTRDTTKINAIVDSMTAEFSTALYDAMNSSIEEIKKADGVKVLVVLTDGRDNSSVSTWESVVANSTKENIPIYIIGLGDVNRDTLELIAKSTHGHFYFTQSSSSLDIVYAQISKQVQAFYDLVYYSTNLSSADSVRQIEISFNIDSLNPVTQTARLKLPNEVISYISKKETQKKYVLFSGIALLLLITAGTLFFRYQQKRKDKPVIKKLFPNPTDGNIIIDCITKGGKLQISNLTGQVVKTLEITGNGKHINLTDLPNGNYAATIISEGRQSNVIQFIIEH